MFSSKVGLIVHDTISVASQGGDCQIQLCFGDITKLQKKDKVDVIFVSSFGGNYNQVKGTVIGALYENLGVSVQELAEDKEEDLRTLYSCWWSKPLPSKLPYRRLLCFESRRNRGGRPQELVGHAFRCLVPILKNKDASVITPLLSTGKQGHDPKVMLESMVHAAVSWIKAGLPIKLLKIVIYSAIEGGKPAVLKTEDSTGTLEKFAELKAKFEAANLIPQEVSLEYDVYLSYSKQDQEVADRIQLCLLEEKPDIRICTSHQELDREAVYQDQMYELVSKSARVITGHEWQRTLYHSIDGTSCMIALISPSYLKSAVCMEEYSLAQTKHLSQDKLQLIPVCISEGVEKDFASISHLSMLDARPDVYDQATYSIAAAVVCWLKTGSFNRLEGILKKNQADEIDVMDLMEKVRAARFKLEYREDIKKGIFPLTCERLDGATEKKESKEGEDGQKEEEKEDEKKTGETTERVEEAGVKEDGEATKPADQKSGDEAATDGTAEGRSEVSHLKGAESQPAEGEGKVIKVAFSYHQADAKFVHFLEEAIKMFAPQVAVTSESSSDQERLDCLEAADHIVALLSPSYTESPQHVEEFHMGLWRQRVSPEAAPVLLPVQVAQLPSRPTYFQLMGPPVNTWDALWAQLEGVQRVTANQDIHEVRNAVSKPDLPKLSPVELLPMAETVQRIMAAIKTGRTIVKEDPPKVRPALINTVKLQRELSTLTKETHKELQEYLVKVPEMPESKQGSKSCTIS